MSKIEDVIIATDGACSGNPGPGGWGAILLCKGGHEREISGRAAATTNNRMELTAVLEGLKQLRFPCNVVIITDSAYIANQGNGGWIQKWQQKGWKTAANKPVANKDLWEQIAAIVNKQLSVKFEKVNGHSGHYWNERADGLAVSQCAIAKQEVESNET